MYDVLIIGGGAAGLTAAMYAQRRTLRVAVITSDIGGQTNLSSHISNYPGTDPQPGIQLMKRFKEQAEDSGATFIYGKVTSIVKDNSFTVRLADTREYTGKTIILAYGKTPRSLGIPGEEEFLGRGVCNCVAYDKDTCHEKTCVVVGGGNSAVEAALELASVASHVSLVHRSNAFRAEAVTLERLRALPHITIYTSHEVTEIRGTHDVETVVLQDGTVLPAQRVFIEIGYYVNTEIVKDLVARNAHKEIVVSDRGETSCPGIFAAGDITTVPFKQTVISAGEGAKAALQAYLYLTGGKMVIDWEH